MIYQRCRFVEHPASIALQPALRAMLIERLVVLDECRQSGVFAPKPHLPLQPTSCDLLGAGLVIRGVRSEPEAAAGREQWKASRSRHRPEDHQCHFRRSRCALCWYLQIEFVCHWRLCDCDCDCDLRGGHDDAFWRLQLLQLTLG